MYVKKKNDIPLLAQLGDCFVLSGVRAAAGAWGQLRIAFKLMGVLLLDTQEFLTTTALVTEWRHSCKIYCNPIPGLMRHESVGLPVHQNKNARCSVCQVSRELHTAYKEKFTFMNLQSSMATMNSQKWFHPSFWSSRFLSLLPVTWSPCQRHHPHSCIGRAAWNHSILWFRYSIAVKTVGPMKSERWSASVVLLLVRQLSIRSDEMPLVEVPRTPLRPKLSTPLVTSSETRTETTDFNTCFEERLVTFRCLSYAFPVRLQQHHPKLMRMACNRWNSRLIGW